MSNLSIGLTGLDVAQRAIELIGTNISNAATAGYHRQDMEVSPIALNSASGSSIGGAKVSDVRRAMDDLLEREMSRQQTNLGQTSQELQTLQYIQSALGEMGSQSLTSALDNFFAAIRQLSVEPSSLALQTQLASSADTMAGQFRNLGTFLDNLQNQIRLQAGTVVQQVNDLAGQIANLNQQIDTVAARGGEPNLLRDQRDQAIQELSSLIEVQTSGSPEGVVNVTAWGTPLVQGNKALSLEVGAAESGKLGISVVGANYYQVGGQGGKLGGLMELINNTVPDIQGSLDTLAGEVINGINRLHAEGVGTAGSFTELTGAAVGSGTLASWNAGIAAGSFFVRVINRSTGQITRTQIAIDPSRDTAETVAAKLGGVDHLSAAVVGGRLSISVDDPQKYQFDFVPALTPAPTSQSIGGTVQPTISGIYSGADNATYTFTAGATGQVGVTDNLTLEVRRGGVLVKTLDIGKGYAAGEPIDVVDGIKVALDAGTVNSGDQFTVQALARSDTTGFLAAAGLNAFFSGSSARDIAVSSDILNHPERIASSIGPDLADNMNLVRMADFGDKTSTTLGASPIDYYHQFVTGVGQRVATAQAKQDGLNSTSQELQQQRDSISGVDVNEEAARLLMFQQMYQAVAKFIGTQSKSMDALLGLL